MSERSNRLYCRDILESGAAIRNYVAGIDFDNFSKDRMRYSAVIREFEIIGEAVGKLADDLEIVWNTIRDDLPVLMEAVQKIENRIK